MPSCPWFQVSGLFAFFVTSAVDQVSLPYVGMLGAAPPRQFNTMMQRSPKGTTVNHTEETLTFLKTITVCDTIPER